ncbi:FHA domain-containing protein [Synechococcus sp. Nb3U1]|uniref:FHA domain-containing protein n=1 Tax=Synechococcus sp. Nb3U1 TaxID=1914529 RepID=UPI001F392C75|nr:FHA domain-containing protein [Synechococcus sp. Nb3U1]MCF2972761.1 FHA domain-containing protein [Synechococcus sp. Nb3U1]
MASSGSPQLRHVLVLDDTQGRRALILDAATYSLGRDLQNSIPLHSSSISRQHALLLRVPASSGYRYRILDGNAEGKRSTNGIRLNGIPCTSQDLEDGDLIEFGPDTKARYYRREMAEEEIGLYAESLEYRSIKTSTVSPKSTDLFGDKRDRVLLLQPHEYQRSGVLRPGLPHPVLGLIFQNQCYYFERLLGTDLEEAIEQCRSRLEHPLEEREFCVLIQDVHGYRLALHQPQLVAVPYDKFLETTCRLMRRGIRVEDRRWRLRKFEKCFVGLDAVAWLAGHFQISRPEAVQVGQECLQRRLFLHVLEEQDFADEGYYYRFREDGGPEERVVG